MFSGLAVERSDPPFVLLFVQLWNVGLQKQKDMTITIGSILTFMLI